MKEQRHQVHFRCEVLYRKGNVTAALVPGQAFPIKFNLKESRKGKLGTVEVRTYAALFLGDRVYTDIATYPLSRLYIEDEGLARNSYTHTTKDGYGITILNPQDQQPGMFDSDGRISVPYLIEDVLYCEANGVYITGPASYVHTVPGIYAKLTHNASETKHDTMLWDVETGNVCRFRKLPIPMVLGQFDSFKHQQEWQKELLIQAFSPFRNTVPLLHTLMECAMEDGKYDIFDTTGYYYALPSQKPCEGFVTPGDRHPRIALLPKIPHDALGGVDFGRQHVSTWRNMFKQLYHA